MKKFLILMLALTSLSAWADGMSIRFEPLYGVEHSLNRYPEPERYSTRTFFGARVLAGLTLLSLEVEGNQSNGRRDLPSQNLKTEDQTQRLLIGLRSTVPVSNWVGFFARAGARGSKEKTTITDTSTLVKTVKEPPIQWDPYAGTGIQIALSNILAASAGATWIFIKQGKPDVQYTLGLTMKFGKVQ